MREELPVRSGAGPHPVASRYEGDDVAGARRSYWIITLPSLLSTNATAYLLLSMVFTDIGVVGVGGLLGPFLVQAWQFRPSAPPASAPEVSVRFVLAFVTALLAVDALALVVGLRTDRLPSWGPGLALVLLVVHLALLVLVVVHRGRFRGGGAAGPPGPVERPLPWRHLPEPLRSACFSVAIGTALALGSFVASELVGASTESAGVLWAGSVWGGSWVVLGVCLTLDVRGSAGVLAHRSQVQRGHRGFLAAEQSLPRLRRFVRGTGVMGLAVGGLIAAVFWPWQ